MDATKRALMNVSGLDILGFVERVSGWLVRTVLRSVSAIRKWNRRHNTRRALLEMDDHMLKDIGISRADALREGRKAFWKD